MASSPVSSRNRLLASLPPDMLAKLMPKLTPVACTIRQEIYQSGGEIDAAYFPESGMISLVANLDDGTQAEVGIVGREGMLGTSLLLGVPTSYMEAMAQLPGTLLRMPSREFRQELDSNAPFRMLLLRYHEAMQAQVMQTAACNGHHGLEQRLARWLLMAHDRCESDDLPLTQDFMSVMLGVHRPSVTVTAGILQRAGLIRYSGGRVSIVDRPSLEAASCECYAAVQRRYAALVDAPNTP